MTKTAVKTEQAPQAIGPYSQAVISDNTLFCSGQIPLNPQTGELVKGDIREQTHQVLKNLSAILNAGGSHLNKVLKTTIYIKNMNNFKEINEVYSQYFQEPFPARATVEVSKLPLGVDVEIDAIAKVN